MFSNLNQWIDFVYENVVCPANSIVTWSAFAFGSLVYYGVLSIFGVPVTAGIEYVAVATILGITIGIVSNRSTKMSKAFLCVWDQVTVWLIASWLTVLADAAMSTGSTLAGSIGVSVWSLITTYYAYLYIVSFRYPYICVTMLLAILVHVGENAQGVMFLYCVGLVVVWWTVGTVHLSIVDARADRVSLEVLRQTEEALSETQVLRDVLDNLQVSRHEMSNAVMVMRGTMDVLHEADGDISKQGLARSIGRVRTCVDTLQHLLDVARPSDADRDAAERRLESVDVVEECACVVESLNAQTRGVEIRFTAAEPSTNCRVWGGASTWRRIVSNLILNAIQGDGVKGASVVLLEITRVEMTRCRLKVHDDGPGFPETVLRAQSTKFVTTKKSGSGIGLWVSKSLVESSAGVMTFLNPPSGGATINITLNRG